ncbi:YicC/YloC family endoribonuclease [Saccharibacillus sp. CPCC 101409]|uniref:YicC/YloC family endoribonuclease n=1 Tax=Saccharibacillus sp. CPCC 101409 TaxID=3058041 RepID=UPI0026716A3D|nr:YicC/YloC family endoribonuclease [Saccharibacillus sp. CPCC 101409]MDO3409370.1 YicC/YloC family endoribonuclease [Saccharibacillus sp. CPCC 101409]
MSFSMTGYGQSAMQRGGYKIQFEVKSVNHRYCEVVLRMPREWNSFEEGLRRLVQQHVKRGRIDVYVTRESESAGTALALDRAAAESYIKAAEELARVYGIDGRLSASELLALPDVMVPSEASAPEEENADWEPVLLEGLGKALEELVRMRGSEGSHLSEDCRIRLDNLAASHAELKRLAPTVVEDYRSRLRQRLTELQDGSFALDEHRIGMEVALFADRCSIDEELARLGSHFGQCRELLAGAEPKGRKLDFLIQEMNREVNTIGSKANHLALGGHVVEMKAELEKMREQAANLE